MSNYNDDLQQNKTTRGKIGNIMFYNQNALQNWTHDV